MSADPVAPDFAESARFIAFWQEATSTFHTTLTAIQPDGTTVTDTFDSADKSAAFISRWQTAERNIYFEVNETAKGSRKKPSKGTMVAAIARHADVDPCDGQFAYADERARLHRLAEFLAGDQGMPPTAILDSGNGIQPLWAIQREALTEGAITRIEIENRAIEAAVGAGGTHNIDRLLRLPGTINFPNAKKQRLGRGISRARLLHTVEIAYPIAAAPVLGAYWANRLDGSDLVRRHEANGAAHSGQAGKERNEQGARSSNSSDTSRSGRAFQKAVEMHRAGDTFDQFKKALLDDPETASWVREKGERDNNRELFRTWKNAERAKPASAEMPDGVSLDDFHAFMPMHNYIYAPARAYWPAGSVNARIPPIQILDENNEPLLDENDKPVKVNATQWLDVHKPIEQMTWAPGMPMVIRNRLLLDGGWIERNGVACFNLYVPSAIKFSDLAKADPWLDHVRFIYPDEAEHIVNWLAHRVQHPDEKINHALVLGGEQGIGKDTLLEPIKHAIGPWNFQEASPLQVLGRFNGFLKAVILRISEARDLGEFDRFAFYDHMKSYTAAPPDVLRVDEKNLREYPILNCCGVIITTNHKTDGIFLPADDRRHFVAWSDITKDDARFRDGYWRFIWRWYAEGGISHVAAFLKSLDISSFDVKAPPPKTPTFWSIVDSYVPAEEAELADVIDAIGNPPALTIERLIGAATADPNAAPGLADWLADRKNRRIIPHRLEKCGYVPARNPDAESGMWTIRSRRQAVYSQKRLPISQQVNAARQLASAV